MPRGYVKKKRPHSYYTEKGLISLRKTIRYLEQVPDLKGDPRLDDLKTIVPLIAEVNALVIMREDGIDISQFTKQTKLETSDLEILEILKEAET